MEENKGIKKEKMEMDTETEMYILKLENSRLKEKVNEILNQIEEYEQKTKTKLNIKESYEYS